MERPRLITDLVHSFSQFQTSTSFLPGLGHEAGVLEPLLNGRSVQLPTISQTTQLTVHGQEGGLVGLD